MATVGRKRLSPDQLAMCREILVAVQDMHEYQPKHEAHTAEALAALITTMDVARRQEISAYNAAGAARSSALEAEWTAYQTALSVRREVQVQFGRESNESAAVGFKRPSERKKPVRKKKKGDDDRAGGNTTGTGG